MIRPSHLRRYVPVALLLLAFVLAGCFNTQTGFGTISVTSEPSDAVILLDGKDTGKKTPAVLDKVRPGTRTVTVQAEGYKEQSQTVVVKRSHTSTVSFELAELPVDPDPDPPVDPDPDPPVDPEPDPPIDPDRALVIGRVVQNRGGSPLAGADVIAYETGTDTEVLSTTSDDEGFYVLYLDEGTYDIVAEAPGRAQAKRQALAVEVGERTASVDLIAKEIFIPERTAVAPTLTVMLEDEDEQPAIPFEAGTIIEGLEFATVYVEAEHPVDIIYIWIGNRHHQPDFAESDQDWAEFFFWDFFDAPGENELRIAAYDIQGNWTETVIPFVYAVGEPGHAPEPVHGVDLIAFTYGADLGLYRQQRREMFDRLDLSGDPDLFDLGDGTLIDLSSIRDDVTMYTVIRWDDVLGAWGYEIERARSEHGPWERIAKVGDWFPQPYMDFSAGLQPGRRMYYRVRAIGPNGERGEPSQPVWVEHLPRYEVRLVDPADDARDVSLTPTFRWTHTDLGPDIIYRFDGFVSAVSGAPGGGADYYTWLFEGVDNVTELEYGSVGLLFQDLKPAKTYSWNIDESRAIKFYRPNSAAVALSGPGIGAVNGEFTFTTVIER